MSKQYKSSVVHNEVERPKKDQYSMSNWGGIIPILIIALIVLKLFIYTKDGKRHGK